MSVLTLDPREPDQSGELSLWLAAVILVVALHVGLAAAYLWLRPEPEPRAEAPAFDVAFMPAAPAPAQPPSIDQPDPAPTRMDQPQDLPKDPPKDPPPPVPEQASQPPTPQVEAMVPHEEPPPPAPVVAVEPPPPPVPEQATVVPAEQPPVITPLPERPVVAPEPSPRKLTHDEKVEKRQAPPKAVASPGTKPMRVASAPNPGAESEGAREGRASWLSELAAHIRRFATYPANGSKESGTVQLSVTIDRNGRLLSHHITGSSGSSTLDHAALAVIERAQPFPRFPATMPEAQRVVPVPLHLRPQ